MHSQEETLESQIIRTVRYFDIFAMPVTATQIWWSLIRESPGIHPSLKSIESTLKYSASVRRELGSKWGYYFLLGKEELVRTRLYRHAIAQDKWKLAKRCARYLAFAPFVRALAGSGSLALDNTKPQSDLDMLVITHPRRIWTTRLWLLFISQILGRRRKHWNTVAPDMLCLNHYVAKNHLGLSNELHTIYNAVQYRHVVPMYNVRTVREFQHENERWIGSITSQPSYPILPSYNTVRLPRALRFLKRQLELLLLEPVGDSVEHLAEKLQRLVINRHQGQREGRIALSATELAFHPDTKAPAVLAAFQKGS